MIDSSSFKVWLEKTRSYSSKKQISDCVSRVKRTEKELAAVWTDTTFSFQQEYAKDGGASVRVILSKRGLNPAMESLKKPALPIGSNQMDSIASAVRKYFLYLKDTEHNG